MYVSACVYFLPIELGFGFGFGFGFRFTSLRGKLTKTKTCYNRVTMCLREGKELFLPLLGDGEIERER